MVQWQKDVALLILAGRPNILRVLLVNEMVTYNE